MTVQSLVLAALGLFWLMGMSRLTIRITSLLTVITLVLLFLSPIVVLFTIVSGISTAKSMLYRLAGWLKFTRRSVTKPDMKNHSLFHSLTRTLKIKK